MLRVASSILALAAALTAAMPSGAVAQTTLPAADRMRIVGSADQMLAMAEELTRQGSPAQAETILVAVAQDRDINIRNEARFRQSKLLMARGANVEAAVLLRRVVDERPAAVPARLELARLLHRMGDPDSAWRQVRAAQSSRLPSDVARLVDRYSEALRAARPYGATIEIAMAPDSNINRATRSDTLGTVIGDFEIDDAGKAKSGLGLSMRSQMYRRVAFGDGRFGLLGRVSAMADTYRRSDFNDLAFELSAGPELRLGRDQINVEFGFGQRWFGQKPFQRTVRAGVSYSHPFGARTLARFAGSAAKVDNRFNDLQDGRAFSANFSIERALTPTLGVIASVGADRLQLKDPGYATKSWRAGINLWRDVGRATLSFGAEIGRTRADERLLLFPDVRYDKYSKLSLAAAFRQIQWRGFAPVARVSIERNRSTIEFYDFRRTRSEIGVVRAF